MNPVRPVRATVLAALRASRPAQPEPPPPSRAPGRRAEAEARQRTTHLIEGVPEQWPTIAIPAPAASSE